MKVIKKLKKTVLIQDEETLFMFHVPIEIYEEGDESVYLENGIPYSLSFDHIVRQLLDELSIQQELYRQGIHTLDDLLKNRKAVNDILKKHVNASKIIQAVKL